MAYVIRNGYTGLPVLKLQQYLNLLHTPYPTIPLLAEDGIFGPDMAAAIQKFQQLTGLVADGIVGTLTWDKIVSSYKTTAPPVTSGIPQPPLIHGSAGLAVQKIQSYLNQLTRPATPVVTDGILGAKTEAKVLVFQNTHQLTVDGKIGALTWDKIIALL